MFQAMAIVSMKMGNLGLEVQSLKTRLAIVEGKNKDCWSRWSKIWGVDIMNNKLEKTKGDKGESQCKNIIASHK